MAGRAGLVGTQNIRNNQSRVGGLDHVVKTGTIIEAVENQPWSGEANVHVSIANWVKTQDPALLPKTRKLWFKVEPSAAAKKLRKRGSGPATKEYELDCRYCKGINSALSAETDVAGAKVLESNRKPKRCFEGQQPGHAGFRLSAEERARLLRNEDASSVLFAYINGTDLLTDGFAENPSFIIDFGTRDMLEASAFPKTLEIVRQRVLPDWQKNAMEEQEQTGKSKGEHQICMAMITDHFYTDPAIVAEVKTAAARKAPPSEIAAILERAAEAATKAMATKSHQHFHLHQTQRHLV